MKQFIEFIPVVLFVAVFFYTRDIYIATVVLMVGICLQVAIEYVTAGRVYRKTQVIFWVAMLLGGATVAFRNEMFLLWKPTVVNWLFAAALITSQFIGSGNLIKKMLQAQLTLPDRVWRNLNLGWAAGFLAAGALNLVVAYNFSLEFWVSYKLVGGIAITLIYVIASVVYLASGGYLNDEDLEQKQDAVDAKQ